jgi:hypothetical protein
VFGWPDVARRQRSQRSTRSYVLELGFVLLLIGGIWLFLTNGGPAAVGQLFADMWGRP